MEENLLTFSANIKKEAENLLYKRGLVPLVKEYGEVILTGSYTIDLMLKKDLDISVVNPELTLKEFFDLGYKLTEKFNPSSVFFRDTSIKQLFGRPDNSLYWGLVFEDWKIDLWVVPEFVAANSKEYVQKIVDHLTPEKREIILSIKEKYINDPNYRQYFSSKEIYNAVLFHNVLDIKSFVKHLSKTKRIKTP